MPCSAGCRLTWWPPAPFWRCWRRPSAAEPVFPPGLRIGLEPPGDLKPSTRFAGFEDPDRKVAITILDLPAGAYAETRTRGQCQEPARPHRREAGELLVPQRHRAADHRPSPGQRRHAAQMDSAGGGAAPTRTSTALINVEVPEAARAVYSDAVDPQGAGQRHLPAAADPGATRPAAVQARRPGRLPGDEGASPGGVILTDGPSQRPEQAALHDRLGRPRRAGAARRPRQVCARPAVASAAARHQPQSADAMRIGGLPGFEIRAQARRA